MTQPGKRTEPYKRLAEINRAITTSLNFDRVLDLIVENSAQLVRSRITALLLADNEGLLRIQASRGMELALLSSFAGRMEEDAIEQLNRLMKVPDNETLVSVPVIAKNALTGLLVVVRDTSLTEEEEWQLSALADQAAIALRNARLFEMELAEASRERDETLEALRESNQKFNAILESITDLYYSLDRDWRFTHLNRHSEDRFHKRKEELIGKVFWEVYPEAVGTPLYLNLHRAMQEMVAVHFEQASLMVPGVWFEIHAFPSNAGLDVYLRDITERKQAELMSHRLAAIVESSDDAIVSKDLTGIIKSWNKGAERIFGYKAEEAIGKPITLIVPEDRADEEPAILARIHQGGRVQHFETIRRRKDGSLIEISLTISPVRDDKGQIIGASKIARNISDRKRSEREIRFQADLLSAVEQAVIATDLAGKILYWNSFAEKLYGWKSTETVGRNVLDIIPPSHMKAQAGEILTRIRKGESWSGEFETRKKDGTNFPAWVTDSPIYNSEGVLMGVVGVSVDISARKQAEEERARLLESERQARTEAEAANRLKDEFLATLSHELRNPLNVILGYSELLLRSEEAKHSPFLLRTAETLRRNAMAQAQLVRDLLDLSRLHIGKLSLHRESVSLLTTISNAVETVREEADAKKIEIKLEAVEDPVFVDADPLRLEQIVWNLLNNAVKFTFTGGTVTIGMRADDQDAVLSIRDNGQGIDPEFLPHIWEMFRQADASSSRRHGGMGIGLALVSQLVELHGGSVSVTSAGVGHGAEFTIRIPLARQRERLSARRNQLGLGVLDDIRIMVVDDSEDTIEMLRRLLEMEGALVKTARSGDEALQLVRTDEFDVVLSDISMPEMDGFEFLKRLRALPGKKDLPVLALTGFGRAEDVQRAKLEGFFAHVPKPIDLEKLVQILHELPTNNVR